VAGNHSEYIKKTRTVFLAVPAAMVLALAACSSDDEEVTETSFTHSQSGAETTMAVRAVGDEIMEETRTFEIDYDESGLGSKEAAQRTFDPLVEGSQGIDGYEHRIEYGDTSATETVVIDYEVVDISELGDLPNSEVAGEDIDEDATQSLEGYRQSMEVAGFEEQD